MCPKNALINADTQMDTVNAMKCDEKQNNKLCARLAHQ